MTNHTELIARLHENHHTWRDTIDRCQEAADALEAAQAWATQLEMSALRMMQERDAALARLAAIEKLLTALLHQIDIGDFADGHGHSAKMLSAVLDLNNRGN